MINDNNHINNNFSFLDVKNTITENHQSFYIQEIENHQNSNFDMTETLISNRMNLRKNNMKTLFKNRNNNGFLDNVNVSNSFNDYYLMFNDDELPKNLIPEKLDNLNDSYVRN